MLPASQDQPATVERAARLSVAPMMDRTDRHFRYFMRQITRETLLYSEMVTAAAVLHGDRETLLGFDPTERPLALQLGGAAPAELARCARIAEGMGYDEVDLNVGCPSDRVQQGQFGAALMNKPGLVADCVRAMRDAVSIPVTVKHRIGTDFRQGYEALLRFVDTVAAAGCSRFIVHARIAVLSGLSPKQNRSVPPLDYGQVYRLKRDLPATAIVINGGVRSLEQAIAHLASVDGVMLGRAAYEDPFLFASADQQVFGVSRVATSRESVLERMLPYLEDLRARGEPIQRATRHMMGLFAGRPGARRWRKALAEGDLEEVREAGERCSSADVRKV